MLPAPSRRHLPMLRRTNRKWLVLTAAFLANAAGCTPEVHRYIRFPDFAQPGWAHQQRGEAIVHDPYPLDDVGPEVVGGRPREYQRPVPEVERARMGIPPPPGLQPIPLPTLPVTPPPVVSAAPIVTTPYPAASSAQSAPFRVQQRSPY